MPIKIDVHMNVNERDLTIESCSEIISLLQDSYQNIRQDMYSHFLGLRSLSKAIFFVGFLFLIYLMTNDSFYILLMPFSVIISMIFSLISAEYLTSKSRKVIGEQLKHYKEKREMLLKDQKLKV